MTFNQIALGEVVSHSRITWKPTSKPDEIVRHYSIPAFDSGSYELVHSNAIASNKFLVVKPSLLYSKLNPRTPRVWYVEPVSDYLSVTSTEFMVLTPVHLEDTSYIKSILSSPGFQHQVISLVNGTSGSHQRVNPTDILEIEIPWPVIKEERRAIGDLFEILNRGISSNSEKSKLLEQIAQTIFKSWFVDFDPVHAKARGEKPVGMDEETAALFPDSFEESEMGLIPSGWQAKSLVEVAEYLNGLALQKFPPKGDETDLPVLKIPQLKSGSTDGAGCASSEIPDKYVVNDGDCVFSWSGALEVAIWAGGKAALNQHLFKVIPKSVPNWFSYLATLSHLDEFRAIAQSKATTMGHIQRGHLAAALFPVCDSSILQQADEVISPLIGQVLNLKQQNRSLVALRDALLPRLISGELEIPEELLK